jgi:hypothetical protein
MYAGGPLASLFVIVTDFTPSSHQPRRQPPGRKIDAKEISSNVHSVYEQ